MAKLFDFNNIKRQTMDVILPGGELVKVNTPSKALFEKFNVLSKKLNEINSDSDIDAIDVMYDVLTSILNNNSSNYTTTKAKVKKLIGFDEVIYFFKAYNEFISEFGKN